MTRKFIFSNCVFPFPGQLHFRCPLFQLWKNFCNFNGCISRCLANVSNNYSCLLRRNIFSKFRKEMADGNISTSSSKSATAIGHIPLPDFLRASQRSLEKYFAIDKGSKRLKKMLNRRNFFDDSLANAGLEPWKTVFQSSKCRDDQFGEVHYEIQCSFQNYVSGKTWHCALSETESVLLACKGLQRLASFFVKFFRKPKKQVTWSFR